MLLVEIIAFGAIGFLIGGLTGVAIGLLIWAVLTVIARLVE